MTNDRIWHSNEYRLPPVERLPEHLQAEAAEAHRLREHWLDCQDEALRSERRANGASDARRREAEQEHLEARDAARTAKAAASHAYTVVINGLRADPKAARDAADELPGELTDRIRQLRQQLDAARKELTEAVAASVWVAGMVRPRHRSAPDNRGGFTLAGVRKIVPDNALEQLDLIERQWLSKQEGLHGPVDTW